MTRIFLMSDLHADFLNPSSKFHWFKEGTIRDYFSFLKDVDVFCACGDIGSRFMGVYFLQKVLAEFPHLHAVYCLGNHEYYGSNLDIINRDMYSVSETSERLHIFDNVYNFHYDICGVRFIGATLWTDFNKGSKFAEETASRGLNDYRCITSGGANRAITVNNIKNEHGYQKKRIFKELTRSSKKGICKIVMTHHVPHLPDMPITDNLSYAYHSDFTEEFNKLEGDQLPVAWFSGHTHRSHSRKGKYANGEIYFVSNQYGYSNEGSTGYSKDCILEF